MRQPAFAAVLLALLLAALPAGAAQIERIGRVYPITEPDLLQSILALLREKQQSGALSRLVQEGMACAKYHGLHPAPADNVHTTTSARSFYYDPAVVAERAITGEDGRILVPAGTRVNPLDAVSLSSYWLFFDARDARQVKQADALIRHYAGRVKPILTEGDYPALARQWDRRVYYDQHGLITRKLGTTQVPALVSRRRAPAHRRDAAAGGCAMIVRRLPSGAWQPCQMREIKAGDVFYTCDEAGRGPLLQAAGDAQRIAHPLDACRTLWHVPLDLAPCAALHPFSGRLH